MQSLSNNNYNCYFRAIPKLNKGAYERLNLIRIGLRANINIRLRENGKLYIEKIIDTLYSVSSPYKHLSPKEFLSLQEHIKQISAQNLRDIAQKGSFNLGFYKFIKFVEEPVELKRITNAVNKFCKTFAASKF